MPGMSQHKCGTNELSVGRDSARGLDEAAADWLVWGLLYCTAAVFIFFPLFFNLVFIFLCGGKINCFTCSRSHCLGGQGSVL